MDERLTGATARWYPVAALTDLSPRHVFQGQLLGRELALWRADDGNINVWEDRCLHRGVRLSIGRNDGAELMCQYHGWRYANGTGACTYVPAHPADSPAQTICTRTFPTAIRYGLVWSGEHAAGDPPVVQALHGKESMVLRSLPVNAEPNHVLERLRSFSFLPAKAMDAETEPQMVGVDLADLGIALTATLGDHADVAMFFIQPVDAGRSIVRPVLVTAARTDREIGVLAYHSGLLEDLRNEIEAEAARREQPASITPIFAPLVASIEARADARSAPLRVRVAEKAATAVDIMSFELAPLSGQLPGFQPGAHIDVHLPNGLVRQYSLTNGPGESDAYRIAVKLEPDSRGGSSCLHHTVRAGDVLAISRPHNNFTLRRDAVRTILIAGGIGVTPLISMAKTMSRSGLDWGLHHFVQTLEHVAFPDVLEALGESVELHVGLTPDETGNTIGELLGNVVADSHVYLCGPGPMLEVARRLAADAGWKDSAIHFEYFDNTTARDDTTAFEIALARSARTLAVGAGQTILQVLRDNDVSVPSSCENGACGTCVVSVLDGIPDHQDVYLNETEHRAGRRIMTCVSRSKSERLTLDI